MSTRTAVAAEPTRRVGRAWVGSYALIWLGAWMGWLVAVQLALPDQIDSFDHRHHDRDFAVVNLVAGVVTLVLLPVFGALCDRTRTRLGRRRVWVLGGVVVFALALALTGYQRSMLGLDLAWGLAAAGTCALTAGLTAVVADEVPDEQRGLVSAALFGGQPVGLVIGLVALGGLGTEGRYWGLAVGAVVLALWFLVRYRDIDPRSGASALSLRVIVASMWVSPRRHPDFAWAFGSRLLVNIGNALGTTYLLFFFKDDLHVSDPDTLLTETSLVYVVFTLSATVLGGIQSDRIGRRKVFVAVAATLQGLAGLLLLVAPSVAATFVGAALLGAGYGAFLAVDQALVTAVLPNAADRAKDLGILAIGTNVPQAVGPLLCAGLVAWSGYGGMFLAAGLFSIAGAVLIRQVKAVA